MYYEHCFTSDPNLYTQTTFRPFCLLCRRHLHASDRISHNYFFAQTTKKEHGYDNVKTSNGVLDTNTTISTSVISCLAIRRPRSKVAQCF
ncbi:hypothetical protein AZE42_08852 [Rhizopogon vesiculosus]|uniref:Uncharacterized protein n=1 Tax=Rhizopogon vesiculosus TaxID=180088 RepID=A0A1J8Q4W4_9AGAM|nr:hypothetical protein AZE42_08852 [Rhizopogon vesiculosus]